MESVPFVPVLFSSHKRISLFRFPLECVFVCLNIESHVCVCDGAMCECDLHVQSVQAM